MLYEDVDFKTLSDRYTNSRMVPFLTHIYGVRANLFSINPRQKMTPTMVNQHLLYTVSPACQPSLHVQVSPCRNHRFCFPVSIFL